MFFGYNVYAPSRPDWHADRGVKFPDCLSVRPVVRPVVSYQTGEHDVLKTNEPTLIWFHDTTTLNN